MTRLLLFCFSVIITNSISGQENTSDLVSKKYASDTVKSILTEITAELSKSHPGFYRYNSPEQFEKYIDSIKSTITDSITELHAFQKFKVIISKIGCLHTDLSLSKNSRSSLDQYPTLFPFQVYFRNGRAFIKKNFSNNGSISAGDELLTINGRTIQEILDLLLPAIPSDGYNLSMKYLALYYQFPAWYRNIIEITEDFEMVTRKGDQEVTSHVNGARFSEIAESGFLKEPIHPRQLEFKIEEDIALLTIRSFANSDIKRSGQNFRKFIKSSFKTLRKNDIQKLIVDLRDNTGGTDANAAFFVTHFFDKPFRYWDRIEVTSAISKQIKGLMNLFYRKPVRKDSTWIWRKGRVTKEFDFYTVQKPAKNNYTGKTCILTSGFCMSSCADVAAILSDNKKAIFIGEETGGGYQGNNSGMVPEITLPLLNFGLSIPLQKYVNHVNTLKNVGRGTIPDFPISASIEDLITGYDKTLNFAIAFIKTSSE